MVRNQLISLAVNQSASIAYLDAEDGSFIFGMFKELTELLSKFVTQNFAHCLVKHI